MARTKIIAKKQVGHVTNPRFSSVLGPHINTIVTARYQNMASVDKVVQSLADNGVMISRKCFQEFVSRILRRLPDEQALQMGVDLGVLHAVRVRLKLPKHPSRSSLATGRPLPRFDSRSPHRRIKPLNGHSLARPRKEARIHPPTGSGHSKPAVELPTGSDRQTAPVNWPEANRRALAKIDAAGVMNLITNHQGRVFNMETNESIEPDDLATRFNMTSEEARSCYLDLPPVTLSPTYKI